MAQTNDSNNNNKNRLVLFFFSFSMAVKRSSLFVCLFVCRISAIERKKELRILRVAKERRR